MAKTSNVLSALSALLGRMSPTDQAALLELASSTAPAPAQEQSSAPAQERSIGLTEARLALSEADQALAAAKQAKAPASRIQELQRIKLEASERVDALLSAGKQRNAAASAKGNADTVSAPAPEAPKAKRSRKSSAPAPASSDAAWQKYMEQGKDALTAEELALVQERQRNTVNGIVETRKAKAAARSSAPAPVVAAPALVSTPETLGLLEQEAAAMDARISEAQAAIATAKGKTERSRAMEAWSALLDERETLEKALTVAREEEEQRKAAASRPSLVEMEKRAQELEALAVAAQARVMQAKGKQARENAMAELDALLTEQEDHAAAIEERKREEAARHHEQNVAARPKARQGNGAVILPPNATSEQGERVLSACAKAALEAGAVVTKVARGVLKRTTDVEAVVSAIASRCFKLRTLAPRGKDNLDYAEVHVSDVHEALVAAFQAGMEAQRLLSAPVVEQGEQEQEQEQEQDNAPAPRSAAKTASAGNGSVKRSPAPKQSNGTTKVAIIGRMLLRKEGATASELCQAASMEKMSVPAQAQAAGVVIYRQEKVDNGSGRLVTRYYGKPAA